MGKHKDFELSHRRACTLELGRNHCNCNKLKIRPFSYVLVYTETEFAEICEKGYNLWKLGK